MSYDTAIVIGSSVIAFVFAYLGTKVDGDHKFLQTLFVFMSLALMVGSAGQLRELATINSLNANMVGLLDQQTIVVVYGLYIAIAYYVVMFVYRVFLSMTQRNKKMRRVQL